MHTRKPLQVDRAPLQSTQGRPQRRRSDAQYGGDRDSSSHLHYEECNAITQHDLSASLC